MRIETEAVETTEFDRSEEEILCALHATLDGIGAKLRRVRVRVTRSPGRHVCRLRARFVRGDLLVVEARAASSRAAIEAAAGGLKEALLQRSDCRDRESVRQFQSGESAGGHGPEAPHALRGRSDLAPGKRAPRAPCRLLLALRESESPAAGLDWAIVLARQLRIELHVLRVLSEPARANGRMHQDLTDITRQVERSVLATRETRAWCDDLLPDEVRAEHVCVRVGDFAHEVATRTVEVDPDMIVLPAGSKPRGQMATLLAHGCSRPGLVAREQKSKCTLLAATDLEDDAFPVLGKAAELANHLHASVVAFHTVDCTRAAGLPDSGAAKGTRLELQKERLEMAADQLLYDGEVFVAAGDDPAVAIVKHARELDADTIVVGTRRGARSQRSAKGSTAAEVVERSDRSVVVVPLREPALAQGSWQVR